MLMWFSPKMCQVLEMLCFLKTFVLSYLPSLLVALVQNKQTQGESIDSISLKWQRNSKGLCKAPSLLWALEHSQCIGLEERHWFCFGENKPVIRGWGGKGWLDIYVGCGTDTEGGQVLWHEQDKQRKTQNNGARVCHLGFQSQLCHSFAVGLGPTHFVSLTLFCIQDVKGLDSVISEVPPFWHSEILCGQWRGLLASFWLPSTLPSPSIHLKGSETKRQWYKEIHDVSGML